MNFSSLSIKRSFHTSLKLNLPASTSTVAAVAATTAVTKLLAATYITGLAAIVALMVALIPDLVTPERISDLLDNPNSITPIEVPNLVTDIQLIIDRMNVISDNLQIMLDQYFRVNPISKGMKSVELHLEIMKLIHEFNVIYDTVQSLIIQMEVNDTADLMSIRSSLETSINTLFSKIQTFGEHARILERIYNAIINTAPF